MKKIISVILSIMVAAFVFAGCASSVAKPVEEVSATTLNIMKDGRIISTIVEDFSESYYDQTEMTEEINSEINSFNATHESDSVVLNSVLVTNQIAKVQMTFKNADIYSEFTKEFLFVGTVKEALDTGKDLKVTLKVPGSENETIGMTEIYQMSSEYIVISGEKIHIRCEGKPIYISEDIRVVDEYEIDAYENADDTIIIFK